MTAHVAASNHRVELCSFHGQGRSTLACCVLLDDVVDDVLQLMPLQWQLDTIA